MSLIIKYEFNLIVLTAFTFAKWYINSPDMRLDGGTPGADGCGVIRRGAGQHLYSYVVCGVIQYVVRLSSHAAIAADTDGRGTIWWEN